MPYHQNILFSLFNPQNDRWSPIFKQVAGQSKQEKRQPSPSGNRQSSAFFHITEEDVKITPGR